jgi:chromosome segregation ATPase
LYYDEQSIAELKEEIAGLKEANEGEESGQFEADLKSAKKLQAKANKEVLLHEKNLKVKTTQQLKLKPSLLAANERIKHDERKIETASGSLADVKQSLTRQQQDVDMLNAEMYY